MFYALMDAKTKTYWDCACSTLMSQWREDTKWIPQFRDRPPEVCYDPERAETTWRIYEFQRTQYRPDWPKLVIRKIVPRMRLEDAGWVNARLDPIYVMIHKMRAKHGTVMADALAKLSPQTAPIYAIKRKGKTGRLVRDVLPDSIVHEGMFMFFWDEHDVTLAKIALGACVDYAYDLTPFHV